MKFTEEQEKALLSGRKNRIVSAQAGAGKTGVLVERIRRQIVDEHIGINEMLIVTFTKKAAGEMRARIRQALQEEVQKADSDRAWLFMQINQLSSANIQTLHAFCLEVLQRNFDRLDRDPNLHILSGRRLAALREEALDATLLDAYQQQPQDTAVLGFAVTPQEVTTFMEYYADSNRLGDREIRNLILQWDALSLSQPDPKKWIRETLTKLTTEETKQSICHGVLRSLVFPRVFAIERLLRQMEEEPWTALPEEASVFFAGERAALRQTLFRTAEGERGSLHLSVLEEEQLAASWGKSLSFSFARLPSVTEKAHGAEAVACKEILKNLRNQVKKEWEKLLGAFALYDPKRIAEEQEDLFHALRPLVALAWSFSKHFREAKDEQNGVDFSDVEHQLLSLLALPDVVKELKAQYRLIFFDEYQDANAIQEAIISALSTGDNLFFVGDTKQSIYGFRQALPENFVRRYETYRASEQDEAIDLTLNFRSEPEILDFLNLLFSPLMTRERGGVDYATAGHLARTNRPYSGKGKVTLCVLQDAEEEDKPEEKTHSYLDDISSEAFYVAHAIAEHIKNGGQYRDCAILSRTNARLYDYHMVLHHYGIPFYMETQTQEDEELSLLLAKNLLRFLDNRAHDIALLSTLLSCIGGFTEEEMARIRIAHPEGPFYEALLSSNTKEDLALAEKQEHFFAKRRIWRQWYTEMPLAEWVTRVFTESGLLAYCSALPDGERRQQNLMTLVRMAEEWEHKESGDLTSFLAYIDQKAENGEDTKPAEALSEEDDVVRLMSIHKAKGLQFPVVFLVNTEREFTTPAEKDWLVQDSAVGTALCLREIDQDTGEGKQRKTILQRLIVEAVRQRERAEEVRILYVAMTRAIEQLIIVGRLKEKEPLPSTSTFALEDALDRGESPLSWILHVLSASDQTDPARQKLHFIHTSGKTYRKPLILPAASKRTETISVPEALAIVEDLAKKTNDAPQPLKMTVSQLAKKNQILDSHFQDWPWLPSTKPDAEQEEQTLPPLPTFLSEEQEADAATIGTLLHRALQNLPLQPYTDESMCDALDAMEKRALFTEQERAWLEEGLLRKFFDSPLGQAVIARRDVVERERSFTMRIPYGEGEIAVDGQIDLFVPLEDRLILVDFKSDRHPHPERYREQLMLYAKALELAYHKPVAGAYLYWIRLGRVDKLFGKKD